MIKLTKTWSTFYYYNSSAILGNVSNKIFLSDKILCWSKFQAIVTIKFNNI